MRDLRAPPGHDTPSRAWARAIANIGQLDAGAPLFAERLDGLAGLYGDRVAVRGPDGALSFRAFAALKTRVAAWARRRTAPGDVVCLLMPNHQAYPAIWAGLNQAGAVVALINTNLRQDGLVRAVGAARTAHLIVHADLLGFVLAVSDRLPPGTTLWVVGAGHDLPAGTLPFTPEDEPERAAHHRASMRDTALLIYTSGTTGWPKPARITHYRILEWSLWFAGIMGTGPQDRLYGCLPMYHSTGGVAALGGTLLTGGCAVVRPGFSASRFWHDVTAERCSVFLYIGELCRYLLAAPEQAHETAHHLRLACGNGLRPEIWERFRDRFRIPRLVEFYASTEGNVSLYNCEGKPGAIGRVPGFLRRSAPVALVRCEPESGEIVRGEDGRCVRCTPGMPGEALGRISARADTPGSFDGYTDRAATESKIVRDVFSPGDAWFRTGDLMRQDDEGFFYFLDRLGDTFRWKGENVSTTQVAESLCCVPGVTAAVAYGVAVEDGDGKAGMAAITVSDGFDVGALHRQLARELPSYAIPLFIRVCPALEVTGTYKFVKAGLLRDGYSRIGAGDRLYRLDAQAGAYTAMAPAASAPAEYWRLPTGGREPSPSCQGDPLWLGLSNSAVASP